MNVAVITAAPDNPAVAESNFEAPVGHEVVDLAALHRQGLKRFWLTRDALTGMFNRQHMQALLEGQCERHQRSGTCFGVALIDLDHF